MAARLFILLIVFSSFVTAAAASSGSSDMKALLELKDQISSDACGILSSWNNSVDFCKWNGVSCSSYNHTKKRVTTLNLSSCGVVGSISPSIGNLTFLQELFLMENNFSGHMPPSIGRLKQLQHLNMSFNSLTGEIPINLSSCSSLKVLDLNTNELDGRIPNELGSLSKLEILVFDDNNLVGAVPSSLGNLSSLTILSICSNCGNGGAYCLQGEIPEEFGNLHNLQVVDFYGNMLSGSIPSSLFNLSSLNIFGFTSNQLSGTIPSDIGLTLPQLRILLLGGNSFIGPIPPSLPNASSLAVVDISLNNFTNVIPSDLGRAGSLKYLNIELNHLEAHDARDWMFMESLTNCSQLSMLALDDNWLGGMLPNSIANLSTRLEKLIMGYNYVSGGIPSGIEKLTNLITLDLRYNNLTGEITEDIGKLINLQSIALNDNNMMGHIPSSIGNLTQLTYLYLTNNRFDGHIPRDISNLQLLVEADLSYNRLTGSIPKEFGDLKYLSNFLVLSNNLLSGAIPSEIGGMKMARNLIFSSNNLSGEIPSALGGCTNLAYLALDDNMLHGAIPSELGNIKTLEGMNLSKNFLSGTIPLSFGNLKILQQLYIQENNLSGAIPELLGNLESIYVLNISYNNLDGAVPTKGVFQNISAISIIGNPGLCGGTSEMHLPSCPPKGSGKGGGNSSSLAKVILIPVSACMCLIIIVLVVWKGLHTMPIPNPPHTLPIIDPYPRITYKDLVQATDGFNSINIVGRGRHGLVYKGTLRDTNTVVAVKAFDLDQPGALKSFSTECNVLRIIRHRNVVKIRTSCSSISGSGAEFKALVFDFMRNGSLQRWLHPGQHEQGNRLDLIRRLNVATDIADALVYLHHDSQPNIVHCDLKPANILLGEDFRAYVADFGLAKLLLPEPTSEELPHLGEETSGSACIKGTIGYVAPEYGIGGHVSTAADVYSYGVLLLEMLTGKCPSESMFVGGETIHSFVGLHSSSPEKIMEVVDEHMVPRDVIEHMVMKDCVFSLSRVGLACSNPCPKKRMTMVEVAGTMHAIKLLAQCS